MLQKLVDQNVLLLTDDTHFDKLKKAATELSKRLQKSKPKTLTFVYTALDSNVPAASPEIAEVQLIVTKGWNTFSSNAKDSAVAFIRAVILEALEIVAKDENFAALIWLASKHILQYQTLVAAEKEIVVDFLAGISKNLQEKAEQDWSLDRTPEYFGYKSVVTYTPINKVKLESLLVAAATDSTYGGENPVSVSGYDTWHKFFAKKAADSIGEEVGKAIKSAAGEVVVNQQKLLNFFNATSRAQDLRAKLLWWKEAGYSASATRSYRDLEQGVLELILSNDYAAFLSPLTPASVDYFLLNVYANYKDIEHKVSLGDFLTYISNGKGLLKSIFPDPVIIDQRISLLEFVYGLIWDKFKDVDIKNLTGLNAKTEVKLADLMLWLYDDKQVIKLKNS